MGRTFVTGATGFIGGALSTRLLERGDDLVGLARSDASAAKLAARGIAVARGDVLDEDSLAAGMAGCELVYHCAGINSHCPPDPKLLLKVNALGPELVVNAAARAGVRRVVFTSSAASVGEPHGTVGDEHSVHRGSYLSVYDRSKHEGEQAAFAAAHRTGVELVADLPLLGPGPRPQGRQRQADHRLRQRQAAGVRGHLRQRGGHRRLHRGATCSPPSAGAPAPRYVLNGATITSAEALELIAEVSGVHEQVRIVPPPLARSAAALLEAAYAVRGRVPSLCRARIRTWLHGHRYDGSLATRELGLAYTPVRETFRRTIEWAAEEGLVEPPPG